MQAPHNAETFGQHSLWREDPFAVFLDLVGDVTAQHIQDFLEVVEQAGKGEGPVIIVQDLSKVGSFSSGARKTIAGDARAARVASVICIGASFQLRVTMTMLDKTLWFMKKTTATATFANDIAAAREILESERRRLVGWRVPS